MITVANTAIRTVSAIVSAGATPRFVDIVPGTYLMGPSKLESPITPRTKCIVPVHLFGQCVDMDAVFAVAHKHGLKVLEDCAQGHGARFRERIAGSMGDAAAFSFYPTKILCGDGDGAKVLTNSGAIAAHVRRLRRTETCRRRRPPPKIFSLLMYPRLTKQRQDVACERLLGLVAGVHPALE